MTKFIDEIETLNLDSIIKGNHKYDGKTVRKIIEEDSSAIILLLKKGYYFGDDVLKYAGITKTDRDHRYYNDYNGIWLDAMVEPKEEKEIKKDDIISHEGIIEEDFYTQCEESLD